MTGRIAIVVAVALVAFWGIWLIGWVAFNAGSESPGDGRGQVTTVQTGSG